MIGGTFDPIHVGHLALAEEVLHSLGADKVIFVPSASPPHKEGYLAYSYRHEMSIIATAANPCFEVSSIELKREGPSYTIDTVRELRNVFGELSFVTGADAILDIFSWENPEELLLECEFVVVARPGYESDVVNNHINMLVDDYGARIRKIQGPELDVSSSDIRCRVLTNRPIKYLVTEAVEAYIYKNGLYTFGNTSGSGDTKNELALNIRTPQDIEKLRDRLRQSLSSDRYAHTISVSETAVSLARIYNQSIEEALIAGLLHDIAKQWSDEELLAYCDEHSIPTDPILRNEPGLLHGHVGEFIGRIEYGILSEDVLMAVRNHTIGRSGMSVLEKVIFVADVIEPRRTSANGHKELTAYIDKIRRLAYKEYKLDEAVYEALCLKRDYTTAKHGKIHPTATQALNHYKPISST